MQGPGAWLLNARAGKFVLLMVTRGRLGSRTKTISRFDLRSAAEDPRPERSYLAVSRSLGCRSPYAVVIILIRSKLSLNHPGGIIYGSTLGW
jgi:hypothetical protein